MGAVRSAVMLAFIAVGCAQVGERSVGDVYVRRWIEANCMRGVNCNGSMAGFEQCLGSSWFSYGGALARAIDLGDVLIDDAAFAQCLTETEVCGPFPWHVGACDRAFIGTRTAGAPCEILEECEAGLFCGFPTRAACGVCAPQRPLGASCGRWDACAPTPTAPGRIVRCNIDFATRVGVCGEFAVEAARAPLNAPCSFIAETETFSRLTLCEDGLQCSEDRCVTLPAEGAACRVGVFDCGWALICAEGGTCVRPIVVSELGAPCNDRMTPGPAPRVCDAQLDLLCIGDQCRTFPTNVGEPCGGYDGCGVGLHCNLEGAVNYGICALPRPDGSRCRTDGMCESRFCQQGLVCTQPICD